MKKFIIIMTTDGTYEAGLKLIIMRDKATGEISVFSDTRELNEK